MSRDITLADTFYVMFTTRAFATGIPATLAGTPVVSAYENDSLTQITAGITLGVDHDGVTGLNLLTIVGTGANGYEASKDYTLVVTTGTVSTVSVVGEVVGEFTIGRSAAAVDLANGTDGLGALKAETALIVADTGTDGVVIAAAQTVATVTDVTNAVSLLTATQNSIDAIELDTGTTLSTDIAAVKAETALIVADTGTDGVVLANDSVSAAALAADAGTEIAAAVNGATLADAYAANGVAPTLQQAVMAMHQMLMDFGITGTSIAVRKVDGNPAFTVTLDDATSPTDASR